MFEPKRAKSWERRGGGRVSLHDIIMYVDVVRDDFIPHPVTPATLIVKVHRYDEGFDGEEFARVFVRIRTVVKEHRLAMLNCGFVLDGVAVTFRTLEDAALFRMFYEGPVGDG